MSGHPSPGPASLIGSFVATWRAMLGDVGAIMLLFVGGIVYSFFYPLPYSRESVQQVPVAVVDQDLSAISRQITRYVAAHPAVDIRRVTPDLREAQDLLWKNEIAGVLMIPPGLESKVLSGRRAEVDISGNGVYMMMNKVALNGLAEAVGTVSAGIELKRLAASTPSAAQAMAQRQPVNVNAVALFNVREGYGAYIVPGVAVLIIQQTLLLAITLLFGTWRERGAFPVRRSSAAYFGMLLAFATVAFANSLYFFGFVLWWQDYPGRAISAACCCSRPCSRSVSRRWACCWAASFARASAACNCCCARPCRSCSSPACRGRWKPCHRRCRPCAGSCPRPLACRASSR